MHRWRAARWLLVVVFLATSGDHVASAQGARAPRYGEMVRVPATTFTMGTRSGGEADERPVRRVTVRAFEIDRVEVTVAAYRECVVAGLCTAADGEGPGWADCHSRRTDRDDYPINCVTWDQAQAFCASSGRRLPTEAEWELAARGGDERTYPWGQEAPGPPRSRSGDRDHGPAPVGSYPLGASPFGVLDMAGNVREWCADWYGPYDPVAITDPPGAAEGAWRVVRGGDWRDAPGEVRAARRSTFGPTYRDSPLGFRCARGG